MSAKDPPPQAVSDGAQVTLYMSYDQAVELRQLIVRFVSKPESPLMPLSTERLVLAIYDALDSVTSFGWLQRAAKPTPDQDAGGRTGSGP